MTADGQERERSTQPPLWKSWLRCHKIWLSIFLFRAANDEICTSGKGQTPSRSDWEEDMGTLGERITQVDDSLRARVTPPALWKRSSPWAHNGLSGCFTSSRGSRIRELLILGSGCSRYSWPLYFFSQLVFLSLWKELKYYFKYSHY